MSLIGAKISELRKEGFYRKVEMDGYDKKSKCNTYVLVNDSGDDIIEKRLICKKETKEISIITERKRKIDKEYYKLIRRIDL